MPASPCACVVKKNSELKVDCLLAPSCEHKGGFLKIALEFVGPPWLFPGFLGGLACGGCLCRVFVVLWLVIACGIYLLTLPLDFKPLR